ncbi:hypothetical protein EDC04DRAFT_280123 [Pisolithus marmoratus]|nr:hypothetical protein EDC04DRAFT_280123 [Pisolithus marmoratus]
MNRNHGTSQHEMSDIRILHSPRPPKASHLPELTSEGSCQLPAPDCDRDPWYPFRTSIDYEVSEFVMESGLNEDQTNRVLKLLREARDKPEEFTLSHYNDLHQIWAVIRARSAPESKPSTKASKG